MKTKLRLDGDIFPESCKELIQSIENAEGDIELRINSVGGDVYEAYAVMEALREYPGEVTVIVVGAALSAASFIAVGGGDTVIMRPHAEMMIHDALSTAWGNSEDFKKLQSDLDRVSDNLAGIYAAKAGGEPEQWRDAMRQETWFTAQEAVAAGLADEVVASEKEKSEAPAALGRSMVASAFRGRRGKPPAALLNTQHEEEKVNLLESFATELGLEPDVLRDRLVSVVNEAKSVEATVEVEYPDSVEVKPTDSVTVAPATPLEGVEVTVGDLPEGWAATADETGAVTVTAPAVDPGTTVDLVLTVGGEDFTVTITVVAASEPEQSEGESEPVGDTVTLDRGTYEDLQAAAAAGWEAKAKADVEAQVAFVDKCISEGRVNVARRGEYVAAMKRDPEGTRRLLGGIPKNTIPVAEVGHGLSPDVEDEIEDKQFDVRALLAERLGKK